MAGGRRRSAALLIAFALALSAGALVCSVGAASVSSLVPAFLWSNFGGSDIDAARHVSYETLSSKELGETLQQFRRARGPTDALTNADVVMVFVGTKLRSADVSRKSETGTIDLPQVLSTAVMLSNSSMSLPYVRLPTDGSILTEELLAETVASLEEGESRLGQVVVAGSCALKGAPRVKKVLTLHALQLHMAARKTRRAVGETDLVVVCSGSEALKFSAEGRMLADVLWGLDTLKLRYVALYTTDLSRVSSAPSSRPKGRQLASGVYANDDYCNEVCQSKALVLEGLFVGLTLLIILLSGICCLAGITTPNRFEQSKDDQ